MQINRDLKYSCAYAARALRKHPDVVSVGIGYRYRGGVKTNELCVVVGVRKKYPPEYFAADENRARLIKKSYIGTDTDIQEYGDIWILGTPAGTKKLPQALWAAGWERQVILQTLGTYSQIITY
jgi:hypothetical protein